MSALVADVYAALVEQVLYVAQRQGVLHVHHHHEADHLRGGVEAVERGARNAGSGHVAGLAAEAYRTVQFV
jgi:hypothetical protein